MDIIRRAEEKDYWNILELENTLNNQNTELFPDIFKKSNNTVPKEIYNKKITDGDVFAFEHNGEIIGFYRAKIFEYQDDETTIYQKIYFIYNNKRELSKEKIWNKVISIHRK
jgi:hypothetical protein